MRNRASLTLVWFVVHLADPHGTIYTRATFFNIVFIANRRIRWRGRKLHTPTGHKFVMERLREEVHITSQRTQTVTITGILWQSIMVVAKTRQKRFQISTHRLRTFNSEYEQAARGEFYVSVARATDIVSSRHFLGRDE